MACAFLHSIVSLLVALHILLGPYCLRIIVLHVEMEELKPLQPRVEDESEVQVVLERAGGDMDGSTAVTEGPNTPSVLAVPVASHLAPTNGGSPSTTTSLPPTQPSLFPQQLFDSHPIQQPLLTSRDDIASLTHLAPPPNHSPDALRQVSQPVQPTPDAMADKQVKVGDEGMHTSSAWSHTSI